MTRGPVIRFDGIGVFSVRPWDETVPTYLNRVEKPTGAIDIYYVVDFTSLLKTAFPLFRGQHLAFLGNGAGA